MSQPLVSIITTVRNREQYLSETIESVLSQSYSNFELLIWDDGSTDDSIEIARHYAAQDKRIRVVAATHHGRVRALIGGILQTTGQYIGLVDSDDLLAITALEETVAVLETNVRIGLVYTDYQTINERNQILGYGKRCQIPYSKEALLLSFMVFHFRLMRRSVYKQVGGFDDRFPLAQDYDLCLKLSEITEVSHLQRPLYYYRVHDDCVSSQKSIEQILCSKQAIENAMQRRGLAQQYELQMRVQAHFNLLPQSGAGAPSLDFAQPVEIDSAKIQRIAATTHSSKLNLWALSAEALKCITQFIESHQLRTVVEVGSGASTVVLAELKQEGTIDRSITLEHDAYWYQDTVQRLQQKNLLDRAEVVHCPLHVQSINGDPSLWYNLSEITPLAADLILVDGPPHTIQPFARYPAPHLLHSFIRPGTWLILDDYHRDAERETVKRWLTDFPTLRLVEVMAINTGLAILQFS
ncbi:MAG: glycosyltransferase [Myxacorys chilensis ATA2-1-KO14]|jgi:GT2 family glycosyltransferase|nr:glycosyltransferase [Myxacorys chilensis ATA2-1-KO14]